MEKVTEKLILEDMPVVFRNFAGAKGMYNKEGERSFSVLIEDESMANELAKSGWSIRQLKQFEDNPIQYHLPVKVDFSGRYPPRIYLIKTAGRLPLNEDTVAMLDFIPISAVDVILNPYNWEVQGETGVKAYLNTLYVMADENLLDKKWAELPEIGSG